jgi:predicted protein tyrosine phosphatase
MLMRSADAGNVKAVISIHGAHEFPIEATGVPHQLVLQFDDIDSPDPSDRAGFYRFWARQQWAKQSGRPLTPPTPREAGAIIDFARSLQDVDGIVLCQCGAGMSRSPAAALLCLAAWTEKGHEQYCVEQLARIRPAAVPLISLVRMGDTILARDGILVRAVLGRGRNVVREDQ